MLLRQYIIAALMTLGFLYIDIDFPKMGVAIFVVTCLYAIHLFLYFTLALGGFGDLGRDFIEEQCPEDLKRLSKDIKGDKKALQLFGLIQVYIALTCFTLVAGVFYNPALVLTFFALFTTAVVCNYKLNYLKERYPYIW